MKKTGATIILAALLAVLLAAGCKGGDEPDETAAERYVVMGGRLVLYSGNAANVIVPDGTASIGNNAFKGCARLENVYVPASVTYIAGGAFHGVEIGYMAYGDTVARWEEVVAGSSGLAASLAGRSVVCTDGVWNAPAAPGDVPDLPTDWQITGGVLTAYTGSSTHVTVPAGVTAIAAGAFAGTGVTAADLPASVTRIEPGAFTDGTVLTYHGTREQWERLLKNGDLTGLTVFAVNDDGELVGYSGNGTHVTIPDGVTAIGEGVFAGHTEITDVTIPKTVTAIGTDAFKGCTGLTDVTVPGSVTSIGTGAFGGCTGLTDVTLLGGVTSIGTDAFKGCTGLTDVTLPASVTDIGGGAFEGCDSLAKVTYGGSREELEELVGGSGIDLSGVTVTISGEASTWDIRDGVLVGYYGTETDITIPDGVTAIGEAAFAGSGVTTVTISEGVKHIDDGAFQGCGSLTHVEIPLSVDSIGYNAFAYCDTLETITFTGTKERWIALVNANDKGIGLGDDVTVTCSDGIVSETVYVRGADAPWYTSNAPGATASDDNPGTRTKPFATIQKAVDAIIARNDGTSAYTIYVDGTLTQSAASGNGMASFSALDKKLTLTIQALSGTATLNANKKSRVIYAAPASGALNLTLENLVITGGRVGNGKGGGVYVETGTFTMNGGAISGNTSSVEGGGVYVANGGTFTMDGGTISGNTATQYGGGIFVYGGTLNITNGTVGGETADKGNKAFSCGGVYVDDSGTFTMSGGEISGNTAGGVEVYDGTFTMSGGTISGNTAANSSGGVYVRSRGTFTMDGGEISGNTADNYYGGGVYVYGGTFTMSDGTISGNTAKSRGGGVYVETGTFTKTGGTISGNTAGNGGGVHVNAGTFTMSDGEISGNTAGSGGGVYIDNRGSYTMSGGEISGNTANSGVGVYVSSGTFTMSDGTISGNIANNYYGSGIGVYVEQGTFNMSGAAKVESYDDVYLYYGYRATLCVAGALTASSPVAKISLNSYSKGASVLSAGAGVTITQDICDKFVLSYGVWRIVPNADKTAGVLKESTDVYVASTGNDDYSGTRFSPFATIQKAVDTVIARNDGASEYTIYVDGTVTQGMGGGNGMADFSKLDKNLTLTIKALSGTATLDANGKSRVIYAVPASGKLNLTLENLTVTGGKTTGGYSTSNGSGIYFQSSGGNFTMSDGTITGNSAGNDGGGVYIASGTFTMGGGTISNNTAPHGGGVYVSGGTFTMSGSASIPAGEDGKNDVYLASGKKITVAGALTAESPVATITPAAYTAGTQVLTAGTGMTITQDICDKFALTPASDDATWEIAPDGTGAGGVIAQRTYTFKVESGGTEIAEGSELPQSATITLSEVRRDGVALTESDGTFLIELTDGYQSFASIGLLETSATGLPATISLPPLPPSPIPLLVYVKAELANGIVIEDGIEVLIVP